MFRANIFPQTNLVKNGDFEITDARKEPLYWNTKFWDKENPPVFSLVPGRGGSGNGYQVISKKPNDVHIYQYITV
ncbi:MAG TPA: hypothetical protein VE912_10045, partial [Bacteroidales bacterium]|nr:hypothetical protein [Bacteroidales bacterium]